MTAGAMQPTGIAQNAVMSEATAAQLETATGGSDEIPDHVWNTRCDVLHRAYVSYRYHRKRQRFFDLLDKGTKSLTVALGASLIGDTLKRFAPLAASAISLLGLLALVFGYGDRKQAHKELAEMAMQVISTVEKTPGAKLNAACVGEWSAEMARMNAKEPPTLKTLVIICEREQATATGHPDHVPLPKWRKRVLADFFS